MSKTTNKFSPEARSALPDIRVASRDELKARGAKWRVLEGG